MKHIKSEYSHGFALPTILIVSIVMLIVLLSAVTATSSIRVALSDQYYNQLAQEAAESGIARANNCLQRNGYIPQWGANHLYPNTSCSGGSPCTSSSSCYVLSSDNIRTTFEVEAPVNEGTSQNVSVIGTVQLLRSAGGAVWKTYTHTLKANLGVDVSFDSVAFGYFSADGGGAYFLTIAADNSIRAVGTNTYGQLSNGTTASSTTPRRFNLPDDVNPVKMFTNFLSVGTNVFVLASDGRVYGAGENTAGQLGDGTMINRSTAVRFQLPVGEEGRHVGVNGRSTFVLTTDGNLYAAGECDNGLLGTGYTIAGCIDETVAERVDLPTYSSANANTQPTTNITLDAYNAYIRMEGGRVYGWGQNQNGQLANGTTTESSTPVRIGTYGNSGQPKAVQVATDGASVWVVGSDGVVRGAGRNDYGQLGNGTTSASSTLTKFDLPTSAGNAIKIATDQWFVSVLTDQGEVWSAGSNNYGQLGNGGSTTTRSTPTKFILPSGVTAVDVYSAASGIGSPNQFSNTFVIGSNGRVYGAGRNHMGQLGDGTTFNRSTPQAMDVINGTTIDAQRVQSGYGTTVVLTTDNKIYTVGNNSDGQLGDGTTTNSSTPVANRYTNILPVTYF
ncbi:MAG TPA: hypothetical protein VFM68_01705 [Candidatus Saccharimonadales bacterium]|nr:hypothetical protein [Candidatus Saccharimonadales bacterium]